MARFLVAGAGYVGGRVATLLAELGHEVFGLRRREPLELPGVSTVLADLTAPETLERLPAGIDVVVFAVAPDVGDEPSYRAIYVTGPSRLIEALGSGEPRRYVFSSSTAVYAQDDGSVVDEASDTAPENFRGRILLEAEQQIAGVNGVSLRLAGIYGPGRARALEAVRSGRVRYTPGRLMNRIHRDDAAGALLHLALLDEPGSLYVGVDHEPVESEAFYRWLAGRLGVEPEMEVIDPTRGSNKRCSNRRLLASGYRFRFPTFREGFDGLIAQGE